MSARKIVSRTPTHHNITINRNATSAQKRFVSRSNESLATTTTVERSHFKRNLLPPTPVVDKEMLYDFAYNEYLNNILLKHITEVELKQQTDDMESQIMYQLDSYQKLKESCRNYEQKLSEFENFKQLDDTLTELEAIMNCFKQIGGDEELCKRLEELLKLLKSASNKLYLVNVKPTTNQQDYDKLLDSIQTCMNLIGKLLDSRNIDAVHELAANLEQLDLTTVELKEKQGAMKETVYHQLSEMLKTVSYIFAKRSTENPLK